MQCDQQSTLDRLKDQGPEAWLEYLRLANEDPLKRTLSTDVIFRHIAPLAIQQESLEWAEVAIRAAEQEAKHCDGAAREGELLRAMQLRSWFIGRRGSVQEHFVVDKRPVLSWVESGLCFPIDAAREKAFSIWANLELAKNSSDAVDRALVAEDMSRLRWIKHRLNVAQTLLECGELPEDSTIRDWLELRELLP